MSAVTVKHHSRDHIKITPSAGWEVIVFNDGNGKIEIVVVATAGDETIRLRVEPPKATQQMKITVGDDRGVDIQYVAKVDPY